LLEGCLIVESVTQPKQLLVASGPFGPRLSASAVAAAIARGIEEAGLPEPDICPLPLPAQNGEDARTLLDGLGFDARMRRAHAVVLAERCIQQDTLRGSVAFEIATRARQAGVPAYAVTAENRLDRFDARILDLQVILQARGVRALVAAGRKLAQVV
jgi:glycerate kinase